MKLEFKKSISNKVIIILGAMFVFLFLLGYFLLVGIDKVSNVTPERACQEKCVSYSRYFFTRSFRWS